KGDAIRLQAKPESGAPPTILLGAFDPGKKEFSGKWRIVNDAPHGVFHLKVGKRGGDDPPTKPPKEIVGEIYPRHQGQCTLDLEKVRFIGEAAMLTALVAD